MLRSAPNAVGPIVFRAVPDDLSVVSFERAPALHLHFVDAGHPPPAIIAAVPLEPAAVVRTVQPSIGPPCPQRLPAFDFKEVALDVRCIGRQGPVSSRRLKPLGGEFILTVVQILAFEHAEGEHLPRREVRFEYTWDMHIAERGGQSVAIAPLVHLVRARDNARHVPVIFSVMK